MAKFSNELQVMIQEKFRLGPKSFLPWVMWCSQRVSSCKAPDDSRAATLPGDARSSPGVILQGVKDGLRICSSPDVLQAYWAISRGDFQALRTLAKEITKFSRGI